jgi:hypothetical protein
MLPKETTMAASDKSTRRTEEVERLRHLAATEAAAFATTAGTMLLGLLTGAAEAAQHRNRHETQGPDANDHAQPPHGHPIETTPSVTPSVEHMPAHDHYTATIGSPSPTVNSVDAVHADAVPSIHGLDTFVIDTSPGGGMPSPAYHLVTPMPVWSFEPHTEHVQTTASGTDPIGTFSSLPFDPAPPISRLATAITGVLDTSLDAVSHTLTLLGSTVGQITLTLTGTVDHLADSLTNTVGGLVHDLSSGIVQPLLTDVLGSSSAASGTAPAQHDGPVLDTAGAVPVAPLHPIPLHLGFVGQPTIDGHDWHDGAFSALGIHHF